MPTGADWLQYGGIGLAGYMVFRGALVLRGVMADFKEVVLAVTKGNAAAQEKSAEALAAVATKLGEQAGKLDLVYAYVLNRSGGAQP